MSTRSAKSTVACLLAAHALVVWSAVPLRIDEFPLTWAPMYAVTKIEKPRVRAIVVKDKDRLDREGFRATRADGSEERVRRKDLNVARRNMWRLHDERTWGKPPPRFRHKNSGDNTFDRWLFGIEPGEPFYRANWRKRLLISVNATLGRRPGDPAFIVALHAEHVVMQFDTETLERLPDVVETAEARWRPEWDAEFPR